MTTSALANQDQYDDEKQSIASIKAVEFVPKDVTVFFLNNKPANRKNKFSDIQKLYCDDEFKKYLMDGLSTYQGYDDHDIHSLSSSLDFEEGKLLTLINDDLHFHSIVNEITSNDIKIIDNIKKLENTNAFLVRFANHLGDYVYVFKAISLFNAVKAHKKTLMDRFCTLDDSDGVTAKIIQDRVVKISNNFDFAFHRGVFLIGNPEKFFSQMCFDEVIDEKRKQSLDKLEKSNLISKESLKLLRKTSEKNKFYKRWLYNAYCLDSFSDAAWQASLRARIKQKSLKHLELDDNDMVMTLGDSNEDIKELLAVLQGKRVIELITEEQYDVSGSMVKA